MPFFLKDPVYTIIAKLSPVKLCFHFNGHPPNPVTVVLTTFVLTTFVLTTFVLTTFVKVIFVLIVMARPPLQSYCYISAFTVLI